MHLIKLKISAVGLMTQRKSMQEDEVFLSQLQIWGNMIYVNFQKKILVSTGSVFMPKINDRIEFLD